MPRSSRGDPTVLSAGIGTGVDTLRRLGLVNVGRVVAYRVGLRTGLHPARRVRRQLAVATCFAPCRERTRMPQPAAWLDEARCFGWYPIRLSAQPPAWHTNPFTGESVADTALPWWKLLDFPLGTGDIKAVWEASRFEWVLAMGMRAAAGNRAELNRLNAWLADWCRANPPYHGPNWTCGQEASIRVLHLAMTARLLLQDTTPQPDLVHLIEAHLARIRATLSYGLAQDNNHGIVEAAALFIGGGLCGARGVVHARDWAGVGRRSLEERVARLFQPDGSFSMYSVNYHRVVLTALCAAELWRRWHDLPPFSRPFRERARAAALWLHAFVDSTTGDAPNFGANDGARILTFDNADFRDYRPAVQLGMAVLAGQRAYPFRGPDAASQWLGLAPPADAAPARGSVHFGDGGYAVLRRSRWLVLLRVPQYRFRPHHCDALHVDAWRDGRNLLRDGGSFGYFAPIEWQRYFAGTTSHNTVQFDDREQMPELGPFLRGGWLVPRRVERARDASDESTAAAGYRDVHGAIHDRRVVVTASRLVITDRIAGFANRAVLRWRLAPAEWELQQDTVSSSRFQLSVSADVPIRCRLVPGWESRYYMRRTELPVLEVELESAGTVITVLHARDR